jgi:hypothetical protein
MPLDPHSRPALMRRLAGTLGLSSVGLLAIALGVFASLDPEFHPLQDYVSKLGARGQPHALGWNLLGFVAPGVLFTGFGIAYGRLLQDRTVGVLLALFGIGFATAGVPIDLGDEASSLSKAHIVALCLGLGAFLLCLARMTHRPSLGRWVHRSASVAATLLVLAMAGQVAQLWAMPVTHRLVFAVVFVWLATTSIRLLREPLDLAGRHETARTEAQGSPG